MIHRNQLTPGILLAFMLYQGQLQNEVLSLMNSYTSLIQSSGAGDKVFALLDRVPPPPGTGGLSDDDGEGVTNNVNPSESENRLQYDVNFECVNFAYPSRPENPVLRDLTLNIERGKTVALVGKSGCGKTTMVRYLSAYAAFMYSKVHHVPPRSISSRGSMTRRPVGLS